ncbi:unnamed protein product [Prunus armeniaca]
MCVLELTTGPPSSARIAAQNDFVSLRPARNAAQDDFVSLRPARNVAQDDFVFLRPARMCHIM